MRLLDRGRPNACTPWRAVSHNRCAGRPDGPPGDQDVLPSSTSGAPSLGAATSFSKCTRQANLRKHSVSIAPRLHHDRPDGHKVGASAGAIGGDIWRPTFVGPCAVGASDPAPSNRSTPMTGFMPTLMPTLRTARPLAILLLPAPAACGQTPSPPPASPTPPPQ